MNNPSYQNRENIYRKSSPFPIKRNKFDLSYEHKTNFKLGKLIPIGWTTVLPGDTIKVGVNYRAVCETLVKAGFYNLKLRFRAYYVSNRMMWKKWDNFFTRGQDGKYTTPMPTYVISSAEKGGLTDYLGFPVNLPSGVTVTPFPFVAYDMIYWNNFINKHIEKNLPYYIQSDLNSGISGLCENDFYATSGYYLRMFNSHSSCMNFFADNGYGEIDKSSGIRAANAVFNVNWEPDYFTSAKLSQQLGVSPVLPIDSQLNFTAPSVPGNTPIGVVSARGQYPNQSIISSYDVKNGDNTVRAIEFPPSVPSNFTGSPTPYATQDTMSYMRLVLSGLSVNSSMPNINDVRTAFQTQIIMEGALLGGWEPQDYMNYFFGTAPSDYAMRKPVYIGGANFSFYTNEVYQTTPTDTSPLGDYAGRGDSADKAFLGEYFSKEFGIVMILAYVSPDGFSYSAQGLRKESFAFDSFDWMNPAFVNLSLQPIYNKEIYMQGTPADNEIFGFQGIYDELRMNRDVCSCDMRDTLSYWHTNRIFNKLPVLNPEFLKMKTTDLERIFSVQDTSVSKRNQIFLDCMNIFLIDRLLPSVSVPGRLDHRY